MNTLFYFTKKEKNMDLKYFLKGNKKEKKTTKYAPTKSLCDENGNPVEFTIKAISTRENEEIRNSCTYEVPVKGKPGVFRNKVNTNEYIAKMISACVVEPSLFDIDLQNSYGVSKPEELIKEMIDNPAEYDDFAVFIQSYNGFDISLSEKVEQAKNS